MKSTRLHKRTVQDPKNSTKTVQASKCTESVAIGQKVRRLSKTHADYWHSRVSKRKAKQNGKTVESPNFHIRLYSGDNQAWFNLGTPNQAAAARKAKEIYVHLEATGWDSTIAEFKSSKGVVNKGTVGDFLQAVRDTGKLRHRTFLNYQNCLHTIVADTFGVKSDLSKYDYRSGGNQKWVNRINSIRLSRLTPEKITKWKRRFISRAGHSPNEMATAKRTTNSYIRCARSLFSTKILKELAELKLPSPLPFEGVELEQPGSMKYISKINAQALIAAAKTELNESEPEVYKIFLLGLFAGMRKAEIDLAEWSMLDFENNVLRLEETEWLHLKSSDSVGEITVDPEVMTELRGYMSASNSQFIVQTLRPPRNDTGHTYYRCQPIFDRLNSWLRGKGIKANKPVHELRKEIGALIATQHGIYAASKFLRHSDITTTAKHYADHKQRISVGLGKLLDTEIKPAADSAQMSA